MYRSVLRVFTFVCLSLLAPLIALAHHAFNSDYDMSDIAEVAGRVTEVRWANPHTIITVEGRESAGADSEWRIEAAATATMLRNGMSRDSITVGDNIRAAGFRGRRNTNAIFLQNVLLPDGREWTSSASVEPRWADNLVGNGLVSALAEASDDQRGIFKVWSVDESTLPAFGPPRPLWNDSYPLTTMAKETQATWGDGVVNPYVNCANGMPAIMDSPLPMEFVRDGKNIVLHLEELDARRAILMDDADQFSTPIAGPYGYSTGRWDGESLVVRTVAINWLWFDQDGVTLTENTEILQRFTPSQDGRFLDYTATVVNDAVFTEPVVLDRRWAYNPDEQVQPYECEWDETTL